MKGKPAEAGLDSKSTCKFLEQQGEALIVMFHSTAAPATSHSVKRVAIGPQREAPRYRHAAAPELLRDNGAEAGADAAQSEHCRVTSWMMPGPSLRRLRIGIRVERIPGEAFGNAHRHGLVAQASHSLHPLPVCRARQETARPHGR